MFNHCFTPRLILVKEQVEDAEELVNRDMVEQFKEVGILWESAKTKQRSSRVHKVTMGSTNIKRSGWEQMGEEKQLKRVEFALGEPGWGTKTNILGSKNKNNIEKEQEFMERSTQPKRLGSRRGTWRQSLYGNRKVKVSKLICVDKNGGLE